MRRVLYYVIEVGPKSLVAKLEAGGASLWTGSGWEPSAWAYHKISGYDGADATGISAEEARVFAPAAFAE